MGYITADGKRVIYLSERAGGPWYDLENDIRSVPISGGASVSLRPTGAESIESYIHLAPNGSHVLFQDAWTDFLYTAPVDGSASAVNLTPTLPQSARMPLYDMRFSNDGSRVFHRVTRDDGEYLFDLRMQTASGGEALSLRGDIITVGGQHLNDVDFSYELSSDETFVVFRGAATNDGPRALYVVDLPKPAQPTPTTPVPGNNQRIFLPLTSR